MTAVGVAALISAAVAVAPMPGPVTTGATAASNVVEVAHPSTVDVGYVPQGAPKDFVAIATREEPNGLELASHIDIVWLHADGTRLLLDHTDGVCSKHVSTDVVEGEDRVVVTMVDEVERVEPAGPGTVSITACPAIGILHRSGVELASPLGSRQLVVQTAELVQTAVAEAPAQDE